MTGRAAGNHVPAGAPEIRTRHLELRRLEFCDAPFILELLNEAQFLRFIGDKGVRTLHGAREYLLKGPIDSYARHGFGLYAACLRGAPIGICGLVRREGLADPDVGFAFLPQYRLQGYAAESAAAVLTHARGDLRIRRIVAITDPRNEGSIAVLKKIGMKFEGMIRLPEHDIDLKLFGSVPPA